MPDNDDDNAKPAKAIISDLSIPTDIVKAADQWAEEMKNVRGGAQTGEDENELRQRDIESDISDLSIPTGTISALQQRADYLADVRKPGITPQEFYNKTRSYVDNYTTPVMSGGDEQTTKQNMDAIARDANRISQIREDLETYAADNDLSPPPAQDKPTAEQQAKQTAAAEMVRKAADEFNGYKASVPTAPGR